SPRLAGGTHTRGPTRGVPGALRPGPPVRYGRSAGRAGQLIRAVDDQLAGLGLRARLADDPVPEGRVLQLALDQAGQPVPGHLETPEGLVGGGIRRVAAAVDGLRVGLQRGGTELADTGVELLVALPERGHPGSAQRPVRVAENLGDHPAVVLVVVPQPGQVQDGRPDVGLIHPWTGEVVLDHLDLAAVRPGRGRALARRRPVEAQAAYAGTGEPHIVGIDLRGVITVIPREA